MLGDADANFVLDPASKIKVTFTGGFTGPTLTFRVVTIQTSPGKFTGDDDSFVLGKQ